MIDEPYPPQLAAPAPARQRLLVNLASSYANVGLMALITLLVVPIYVHVLGKTQWGIVALCMTLQGVLFSIDMALGPLMLRDVARAAQHGQQHALHRRFLRIYGCIAIIVFGVGQLLLWGMQQRGQVIAAPNSAELIAAARIMLVQFLFQFSNNAAIGFWNGLERQRLANLRLAGFMVAKHALALLLVLQWSATAAAYLLPFAVIGALEFLLNERHVRREALQKILHPAAAVNQRSADARGFQVSAFAGYGLAALIAVLSGQIDRVLLSLTLPSAEYGVYFLIGALTLSLLHLQVPIHRAFLPRMATANPPTSAARAMLKVSLLVLVLPCLAMAPFTQSILQLWLHDATIAAVGAAPLRVMLIAVALLALCAPTSALLLSQHRYRALIVINAAALLTQLLVLLLLSPRLGMMAGALAWLGCGLVQWIGSVWVWRVSRIGASA